MRWKNSNTEVSLFGVNYTAPFAYSYRAQKKLGVDLKKAIDLDISQMARLGLDAFRVHVWDREISDKDGNILNNEHLDLFDYLLSKLEEKNIKIILTPIAWWGNGWPERDENTPGFSQYYSKLELITNIQAREAERNYIKQFINHINRYNQISYKDDPFIIAMEIINEPAHPENQKEVTEYINDMVKTFRNAGYTKPLFYNISQNWNDARHAQAVCNSDIQGVSFQWYPTDLVHGYMLKGNYLINVNHYSIPSDSLTGYNNKAKMVYEFETADVGGAYMYPAIARSFREAGMQFAAMFAYDPSQIAWSNTEYPTHFINLLYTPSKAISLLIASKAFHLLPLMKSYGDYPENNKFGDFLVDYERNLSEMNSDTSFLYTNSTSDIPKNHADLKHIAGCGNSKLIQYDGTGAYFLDKIKNGIWKLEIYPDVLWIRDPFNTASMTRQAARLFWNKRRMILLIDDLGKNFSINSLNESNNFASKSNGSVLNIKPGIYFLTSNSTPENEIKRYSIKQKFLEGLYTPPQLHPAYIINKTARYLSESAPVEFNFKIAADSGMPDALLYIRRIGWRQFEKKELKLLGGFDYRFKDSLRKFDSGIFEYYVTVKINGKQYTFPGAIPGSPEDWDFFSDECWEITILPKDESIVLYNPVRDRENLVLPQWNPSMKFLIDYKNGTMSDNSALSVLLLSNSESKIPFGVQISISDLVSSFINNINEYNYLVVKGHSISDSISLRLILSSMDGKSFGAPYEFKRNWNEIRIPRAAFKNSMSLILPFSYPHFLSKIWNPYDDTNYDLKLDELNFLQIIYDQSKQDKSETGFEIESISLQKN